MADLRMTLQVRLVLHALLDAGDGERYGLQLCAETRLPSGTIYPILARLEQAGWLESEWEHPDQHIAEGRPRRRYYWLNKDGAEAARIALARSDRSRRPFAAAWGLANPATPGAVS